MATVVWPPIGGCSGFARPQVFDNVVDRFFCVEVRVSEKKYYFIIFKYFLAGFRPGIRKIDNRMCIFWDILTHKNGIFHLKKTNCFLCFPHN